MAFPCVPCQRRTIGPGGCQQEMSGGLERMWVRAAQSALTTERREEDKWDRGPTGVTLSHFVNCTLETKEEMKEALDGGAGKGA